MLSRRLKTIVCVDKDIRIGKNDHIVSCPEFEIDFHTKTIGNGNNAVLMGRKTWNAYRKKYKCTCPFIGRDNLEFVKKNEIAQKYFHALSAG